jgi:epsilon-lactone hydrolase
VSTEQRGNLDAILRQSAFPADSEVGEQRRLLAELTAAQPLPADLTVTAAALGGEPSDELTAMIAGSGVRVFRPFPSM